tara:strand:- start:106 stop:279 length:174 start_codon:yes stop_codon:yes gene_type:complete
MLQLPFSIHFVPKNQYTMAKNSELGIFLRTGHRLRQAAHVILPYSIFKKNEQHLPVM